MMMTNHLMVCLSKESYHASSLDRNTIEVITTTKPNTMPKKAKEAIINSENGLKQFQPWLKPQFLNYGS